MNSNSKKKKSPNHNSEVQNAEPSSQGGASEKSGSKKKKIWTSAELHKQMALTSEEIKYREGRIDIYTSLQKCEKYFKCTKCQRSFKDLIENSENFAVHPFLKVIFCKECLEFYEDGEFSVDSSDGEEKYCRWCGEGGLIYSCSECVSGFCTGCIKKHFGLKYNNRVKKKNIWKCFICFPKPLWFLRLICYIAEEKINHRNTSPSPNPKMQAASDGGGETLKKKGQYNIQPSSANGKVTSRKIEDEESSTCCSELISDTKKVLSEMVVLRTPTMKKGIKRKYILSSSSDESDDIVYTQSVKKKAKRHDSSGSNSNKRSSGQNIVSTEVLEKLERILRLAEYQMGFGVSWSSKMLTKLFKPNILNSPTELKNECQKIKWFFSILSTYLIESCSSVDAIEKSIENNEEKVIMNSPEKGHQGDYSTVVKFLDFVTNQVKVFLEKGIRLQDLLEGEIYYDNEVIGVKVRSNPSTSTPSSSQTSTSRSKIRSRERKISDGKYNNGDKTSDDESIVPTLEAEADDSSETETKKMHNLSDPNTDYFEDAEEQKSKIQEILSILENA